MKFKTKEEIVNKIILNKNCKGRVLKAYECGVYDAFESFIERIKFYKRYKNQPNSFWELEDIPKLWNEYCAKNRDRLPLSNEEFNNWLFDYCFQDVI